MVLVFNLGGFPQVFENKLFPFSGHSKEPRIFGAFINLFSGPTLRHQLSPLASIIAVSIGDKVIPV
jgi:hypothetical protein